MASISPKDRGAATGSSRGPRPAGSHSRAGAASRGCGRRTHRPARSPRESCPRSDRRGLLGVVLRRHVDQVGASAVIDLKGAGMVAGGERIGSTQSQRNQDHQVHSESPRIFRPKLRRGSNAALAPSLVPGWALRLKGTSYRGSPGQSQGSGVSQVRAECLLGENLHEPGSDASSVPGCLFPASGRGRLRILRSDRPIWCPREPSPTREHPLPWGLSRSRRFSAAEMGKAHAEGWRTASGECACDSAMSRQRTRERRLERAGEPRRPERPEGSRRATSLLVVAGVLPKRLDQQEGHRQRERESPAT
jgi:hypothetical protein